MSKIERSGGGRSSDKGSTGRARWIRNRESWNCVFVGASLVVFGVARECCQGLSPWQPGLYLTRSPNRHMKRGPWLLTPLNLYKHTHTKQIHTPHSFIYESFHYLFTLQWNPPVCVRAAPHLASKVATTHAEGHGKWRAAVHCKGVFGLVCVRARERAGASLLRSCHHNSAGEPTFGSQQSRRAQKAGWRREWARDALKRNGAQRLKDRWTNGWMIEVTTEMTDAAG